MKIQCETCKQEFDKPVRFIKKSIHNYCSRSCSCIKQNEHRWKNHITLKEKFKCIICGKPRNYRNKNDYCLSCITIKYKSTTLGSLKQKYRKKSNGRWYSSEIRNFAKSWNSNLENIPCQKCNYNLHTELCHIIPIGSFDDNTTIGEINDPSNILVLCPNHHWEFDNKILRLEDIPTRT